MNAFMGRFGVPSLFCPGVPYLLRDPSGVGLTLGVSARTVSSEFEGESDRAADFSGATDVRWRTERRMVDREPGFDFPAVRGFGRTSESSVRHVGVLSLTGD